MNGILSTWFKRYFSHPEAVALIVIFVITVVIFKIVGQVLVPVFISVVLAYLLFGAVKKLEGWHLPHLLAVSVVFVLFMSLLLLALFCLLPVLWEEMVSLASEVPKMLGHYQQLILKLHRIFPELISVEQLQQTLVGFSSYLTNFGKEIVAFSLASLFGVVTAVVYLVLVPLLIFFFLRDGEEIIKKFVYFLPKERQVLRGVWDELQNKIHGYIQGKVAEIIIVAVVATVTFRILGLHYAILLGALVGVSALVPYVGVVMVTVPVIFVGMIQWGLSDIFCYLLLAYAIIIALDANVLVPILFSEVMNLHPLAIMLGVLVFGNLFGFWGVFFAIPLVTLFHVVIGSWPKENLE